ncbi:MAG TPA: sulfotransferase [Mycobacteriales bacterium]|nr:sulfotransferase [Mycobacteriales bacterium]
MTRRPPTFFIIGAQKAGTTSLHHYLRGHPQIAMSEPKEPNYFSTAHDPAGWDDYLAGFPGAADAVAIGEASTTYTMYPHVSGVPERLLARVPDARLIYLVRNPIERMRSAYRHALAWGSETRPITAALRADPRYLDVSRYAGQLDQWLSRVDRDRVLLLSLDQLQADPAAVVRRVLAFVGVDADWRPADLHVAFNPSAAKRAPRAGWRWLGERLIRSGRTDRVPGAIVRLNDRRPPLLTRPIRPDELTVPEALREELLAALRDDLRQLAALMAPAAPAWTAH